jgi:Zn-dependent peptidase ImmA (M78 family)/transcriptional regulator with XRE-family HTH domain
MPGFNRERLTEIRTMRGMTMEQLAIALEKTKQMVSKYEDGDSIPQTEAIKKMAQILSVPVNYLFKESVAFKTDSSTLFLRAPLSTPKKTRMHARIVSSWGYEISCAIKHIPKPFSNLSIDGHLSIPEKAMELRRQWGLGTRPINNMVELLESRGFNIFTIDSPKLKTEAYSQIINSTPVIVINKQIGTAVRQRLSLAHELGHMILHKHLIDREFDLSNKEIEKEAQQFAEYFLLPMGGFDYSFISSKMEHLISLKKEWLVSLGAIVIHCERIGRIDASRQDFLQKQINIRGWQKSEPLDNEIEYEKPHAMRDIISSKITDEDIFTEFFNEARLPIDYVEILCSLQNGSLMRFLDGSIYNDGAIDSSQMEFEQITLYKIVYD